MRKHPAKILLPVLLMLHSAPGYSRIPDEYESKGGHSLGFGNAGVAAVSDQASVKSNPAMLALEKQYTVSGTYNWPSYGRRFYQVGAIDSKTSVVATGLTYTSSQDKFVHYQELSERDPRVEAFFDSATKYRLNLGLGLAFAKLSAGLGIEYIEGYDKGSTNYDLVRGATVGLGLAGLLTSKLRFGIAAENLANEKVANLSPRTYRAGVAYTGLDGDLTTHLDFSQRKRISGELAGIDQLGNDLVFSAPEPTGKLSQEQMVTLSGSVRVQDLIRLMASYGHEVSSGKRRSVGGGVALVNQMMSISYLIQKPYQTSRTLHQGVNLSITMSL